jgi:hypothetical protein
VLTLQARQARAEQERLHEKYKKRMKELKVARQQGLMVALRKLFSCLIFYVDIAGSRATAMGEDVLR